MSCIILELEQLVLKDSLKKFLHITVHDWDCQILDLEESGQKV